MVIAHQITDSVSTLSIPEFEMIDSLPNNHFGKKVILPTFSSRLAPQGKRMITRRRTRESLIFNKSNLQILQYPSCLK